MFWRHFVFIFLVFFLIPPDKLLSSFAKIKRATVFFSLFMYITQLRVFHPSVLTVISHHALK